MSQQTTSPFTFRGGGKITWPIRLVAVTFAAPFVFSKSYMIKVKHKSRHTMPSIQEALVPLGDLVSGIHEACDSVAPIRQIDFDMMVDLTIREKGLIEPIRVDAEGRLVDGRSRVMACFAAGITITSDDVVETGVAPWTIATSNATRRHMTLDQRTMAATKLLAAEQEKAADRKRAGAKKGRAARNIPLATEPSRLAHRGSYPN